MPKDNDDYENFGGVLDFGAAKKEIQLKVKSE